LKKSLAALCARENEGKTLGAENKKGQENATQNVVSTFAYRKAVTCQTVFQIWIHLDPELFFNLDPELII